jgi:hypothetical protein
MTQKIRSVGLVEKSLYIFITPRDIALVEAEKQIRLVLEDQSTEHVPCCTDEVQETIMCVGKRRRPSCAGATWAHS